MVLSVLSVLFCFELNRVGAYEPSFPAQSSHVWQRGVALNSAAVHPTRPVSTLDRSLIEHSFLSQTSPTGGVQGATEETPNDQDVDVQKSETPCSAPTLSRKSQCRPTPSQTKLRFPYPFRLKTMKTLGAKLRQKTNDVLRGVRARLPTTIKQHHILLRHGNDIHDLIALRLMKLFEPTIKFNHHADYPVVDEPSAFLNAPNALPPSSATASLVYRLSQVRFSYNRMVLVFTDSQGSTAALQLVLTRLPHDYQELQKVFSVLPQAFWHRFKLTCHRDRGDVKLIYRDTYAFRLFNVRVILNKLLVPAFNLKVHKKLPLFQYPDALLSVHLPASQHTLASRSALVNLAQVFLGAIKGRRVVPHPDNAELTALKRRLLKADPWTFQVDPSTPLTVDFPAACMFFAVSPQTLQGHMYVMGTAPQSDAIVRSLINVTLLLSIPKRSVFWHSPYYDEELIIEQPSPGRVVVTPLPS